jgi:hypothetical protein
MNNNISFYAIRIKGTDFFKCTRHMDFGSFQSAITNGVFFNQRKNAEKTIKECVKQLNGISYPLSSSRFTIYDSSTSKLKSYSPNKELVNSTLQSYPIEFMEIELEIVELTMKIAE